MPGFSHTTVLLEEAVSSLLPKSGGRYIDATLGGAGHTARLLERSQPTGRVLAIDQDPAAHDNVRAVLASELDRVVLVRSNFRDLRRIAKAYAFEGCEGILFDLGVSSPQFDESERGFSYRLDAPLDMRMDPEHTTTAFALVNELSVAELARIFNAYGEERFARRIAGAIADRRQVNPIRMTGELAEIVKLAIPAATRRTGAHPARRVFQALRIAVNDELGALEEALDASLDILCTGGRVAVITFHSLEDRIVKHKFLDWAQGCICPPDFPICRCGHQPRGTLVTRKPILPTEAEIAENPRARSAKLRVIERV